MSTFDKQEIKERCEDLLIETLNLVDDILANPAICEGRNLAMEVEIENETYQIQVVVTRVKENFIKC